MLRQVKAIAPSRPSFLYVATGATHAPHEWIDKFNGKFDGDWDKYPEATLTRQRKLGVVPKDTSSRRARRVCRRRTR